MVLSKYLCINKAMEEEMIITAKRLLPASCISCKNDNFFKKEDGGDMAKLAL